MSYQIAKNISYRALDDSVVVLNLKSGYYYILNTTSSCIWDSLFAKKMDIAGTLDNLAGLYSDIKRETLEKDVSEEINYWIKEKLILAS